MDILKYSYFVYYSILPLLASGASHCRGFPEDSEGGGEEEEERGEEERDPERSSHFPLPQRAIALQNRALVKEEEEKEEQSTRGGLTCRLR